MGTELENAAPAGAAERFWQLREELTAAAIAGELEAALALANQACELAEDELDSSFVDRAVCMRGAVLISLERHAEAIADQRAVLVRNESLDNCFTAAYNLARAYENAREPKKGLFYARIARDKAELLGRNDCVARALNQIGNSLLAESYFREAEAAYREGLSLLPTELVLERAIFAGNLGYCLVVLGDVRKGLSLSLQSLRQVRRLGARTWEMWIHLDACHGFLELGRVARARQHGERGLALAEELHDRERIKVGLLLLGEAAAADPEHPEAAREYFERLQREFYPGCRDLAAWTGAFNMRQLVNLRA